MLLHIVNSVDEAFQSVVGIESYLQASLDRKPRFKTGEQPKRQFDNNVKPNTTAAKDVMGTTATSEPSQQAMRTSVLSVKCMVTLLTSAQLGTCL